jgi:hypothetical protein
MERFLQYIAKIKKTEKGEERKKKAFKSKVNDLCAPVDREAGESVGNGRTINTRKLDTLKFYR